MRLIDILNRKELSLSFEVFPPKTQDSFDIVEESIEKIAVLKPSFLSVTYGAGGGTSKYTMDIAKNIKEKYGVETLAHLTCVSSSRESIQEKIKDMEARHDKQKYREWKQHIDTNYLERYLTEFLTEKLKIEADANYPPYSDSKYQNLKVSLKLNNKIISSGDTYV